MNVMIVEDEYYIAMDLQSIVEQAGYCSLEPLATMEQALAYANKADIALVDLRLADGMTGPALGRKLMDRFGVEVIYVTAIPEDLGTGLEGACEVITKPFTAEQISKALAKAARLHRERQDRIRVIQ
ncbi:response regulator [Rhizobium mesoamericanum]|uniref:Putative two-component response regulator protein n=1 Tax=Rhizobium mesoamericanum STM3625 TaxID=1211777 RepID=K0Q546_9HYPH|nr:response regulator [Rhizobium mesoamericanum]CCM78169.1 putative two-component response regulator protein [Rhizobium mesoamericanum STM3625]